MRGVRYSSGGCKSTRICALIFTLLCHGEFVIGDWLPRAGLAPAEEGLGVRDGAVLFDGSRGMQDCYSHGNPQQGHAILMNCVAREVMADCTKVGSSEPMLLFQNCKGLECTLELSSDATKCILENLGENHWLENYEERMCSIPVDGDDDPVVDYLGWLNMYNSSSMDCRPQLPLESTIMKNFVCRQGTLHLQYTLKLSTSLTEGTFWCAFTPMCTSTWDLYGQSICALDTKPLKRSNMIESSVWSMSTESSARDKQAEFGSHNTFALGVSIALQASLLGMLDFLF